jgi:hypothetical protein
LDSNVVQLISVYPDLVQAFGVRRSAFGVRRSAFPLTRGSGKKNLYDFLGLKFQTVRAA